MSKGWRTHHAVYIRRLLLFTLLLQSFGFVSVAKAEQTGGSGTSLPSVSITFDVYSNIAQANLEPGGGLNMAGVSLDSAAYHGDSGKSVKIGGRTQLYNRLKIPHAFDGLNMEAGKTYNISLWAKVNASSSVSNGYFFLSVVTYPGVKQPTDPAYYYDTANYKFLVGQDGWTKLTLPYFKADDNPLYGIAVEQTASGGWTDTVPVFNIDDVEVAEAPPPTYKHLTFDTAASIAKANISNGGAQLLWALTLDSTVVHGVYGGKSVRIGERTQLYNRAKINDAFTGLDMTPGTRYNVSLYARTDSASAVKAGYFFLSVIDIPGTITNMSYYSDKNNYGALVTDNGWVKITLPYTVGYDPLYGIAVEQMSMPGYTDVVGAFYIDDVEITKTGMTTEIPPPRIPPKTMQAVVDGKPVVYLKGKPEMKDGVPFIQLPKTFSVLRADVTWDELTQTATAEKNGRTSQITAGQPSAQVNGSAAALDAPAYMKDGVLMVPAHYISDALEATVSWDADEKVVTIVSKKVNMIQIDKNAERQEIWGFGACALNL